MLERPVFLDYNSTTPVDERVVDKMSKYMTRDGVFGNPASRSHAFGWQSEEAVTKAREQVADLINADPREIVWTSGATESNNLAIKGVAHFYKRKGKHIVTMKTEHKAVLDACRQLEREGYELTYLEPGSKGLLDFGTFVEALRKDTILVSIMHVNNEIGVVQDIVKIGKLLREKGIIFHIDAAQSAGKIPFDVKEASAGLVSLSAHKVYGPKGVGVLYVSRKPRVRIEAQIHGGGHERGMRSGTLATHQIVGMGEAFAIAKREMEEEGKNILALRNRLWDGIKDMQEVYCNGDYQQRVPGNLNVSFNFVEGESLVMALDGIAVSSGSACTSSSLEPSYVLRAIGRNDELAHSSIRFSLGRYTTAEEIDYTANLVNSSVERLRALSPLWEMYQEGVDMSKIKWAVH